VWHVQKIKKTKNSDQRLARLKTLSSLEAGGQHLCTMLSSNFWPFNGGFKEVSRISHGDVVKLEITYHSMENMEAIYRSSTGARNNIPRIIFNRYAIVPFRH